MASTPTMIVIAPLVTYMPRQSTSHPTPTYTSSCHRHANLSTPELISNTHTFDHVILNRLLGFVLLDPLVAWLQDLGGNERLVVPLSGGSGRSIVQYRLFNGAIVHRGQMTFRENLYCMRFGLRS